MTSRRSSARTVTGAAALAAALLLTGCVQVQRMPTDPMPLDELAAVQQEFTDSDWAQLGLPDEMRPAELALQVVSLSDWGTAIVDCMSSAGYDGYTAMPSGYSSTGAETAEEVVAHYACRQSILIRPEESGLLTTPQKDVVYDYFAEMLVPCLRLRGYVFTAVPTRAQFHADIWSWNPYWQLETQGDLDRSALDRLLAECPADPPGAVFSQSPR